MKSINQLIKEDDKIIKTFKLDPTFKNEIRVLNCDKCLFTCCDNPTDIEWKLPLTEKEKILLEREYLILPPKNISLNREKLLTLKRQTDVCEFASESGCILKDERPLHCKLFPYLIFKREIVLSKGCLLYQNSSLKEIKIGANIAAKILSKEDNSYIEDSSIINIKDRERFLKVGEDYIFTGISL